MNEWIMVTERLPRPFQPVWIYWRAKEVLIGCRIYEGDEETRYSPIEGWYSFEDEECRCTFFWMPIEGPPHNIEKPFPPYLKD
jgi:hypothetical protein